MKEEDLHYLGGIIDGEGSIQIVVEKDSRCTIGYRVRPRIQVTMKNEEGTEEIKTLFESFFDELGITCSINDDGEYWNFTLSGVRNNIKFLKEIYPAIRLKKKSADIVLSLDWSYKQNPENFMRIMRARDELRKTHTRSRDSKYSAEFFEEVLEE